MGHELKQGAGNGSVPDAAFVDDQSGNNSLHMQNNSRVLTTLIGVITQTSPGTISGLGGNTSMSLPAGAIPVDINIYGVLPASTGATITVGLDTTSNYFINAFSVSSLANSGQQGPSSVSNLFAALAGLPIGSAHAVTGFFAQSATSPGGGPWYVMIDYYKPSPA